MLASSVDGVVGQGRGRELPAMTVHVGDLASNTDKKSDTSRDHQ